jgi:glycosyltransferase involved in cell wall biosynthesis|tara:strand:+ start:10621 stop:11649 length:1029 start_codon:yes stop_codon:yes gene_type:complete
MHVEREASDVNLMRAEWKERYLRVPYTEPYDAFANFRRKVARKLGLGCAYRYGIDDWYDPATDDYIQRFLSNNQVDVVIVEYVFMSRALLQLPAHIFKIIDTHDVLANRDKRFTANNMRPTWFSCSQREETKGLNRADVVIAIQNQEAKHFNSTTSTKVVTVGHPVELYKAPADQIIKGRILLISSANLINVESAHWLINSVLPLIQKKCPGAELAIGGTICQRLTPTPGVRLLGPLDKLSPVYASAQVVVNPMRFGTGLKIKSIEALGHARPLITTTCGSEGLDQSRSDAFRIADEPKLFAQAVIGLLTEPKSAVEMGERGYRYAERFNADIEGSIKSVIT